MSFIVQLHPSPTRTKIQTKPDATISGGPMAIRRADDTLYDIDLSELREALRAVGPDLKRSIAQALRSALSR
jgi:hypothetical protein